MSELRDAAELTFVKQQAIVEPMELLREGTFHEFESFVPASVTKSGRVSKVSIPRISA